MLLFLSGGDPFYTILRMIHLAKKSPTNITQNQIPMGDHVQSANLKDYFRGSTVLGNTPTVDGRIIQTHVLPEPPTPQISMLLVPSKHGGRGPGGIYRSFAWGLINLSIYCGLIMNIFTPIKHTALFIIIIIVIAITIGNMTTTSLIITIITLRPGVPCHKLFRVCLRV